MDNTQLVMMTEMEISELNQHEAVIERGLQTFVEVGNALLAIRDGRLYRADFGTFEEYCAVRWGFTQRHSNRLIAAAEVVNNVGGRIGNNHENPVPIGPIPENEAQARPLTKIEPEKQPEVWQQIVDTAPNGKVTGRHAQTVVDEYTQPKPPATNGHAPFHEEQAEDLQAEADGWEDEGKQEPPFDPALGQQILEDTQPHSEAAHDKMGVHFSSESDQHYTPDDVISSVLTCLDHIDLDPCSNSQDAPNVPATNHYTEEDNGLSQFWEGSVYMNPPYGVGIAAWVDKLCESYECGDVTEAIALVPARPGTRWWRRMRNHPVCFVDGRLIFKGNENSAPFPSALFYLGDDIGKFYHSFCDMGDIWQRIEPGMFGE